MKNVKKYDKFINEEHFNDLDATVIGNWVNDIRYENYNMTVTIDEPFSINFTSSEEEARFTLILQKYRIPFTETEDKSVTESQDVQKLFLDGDLSNDEQQKLKHKLPKKKLSEIDDDRDWKDGDVLLDGNKHYLVVENHEDYCDFGSNYISEYLDNNKDINEDDFGEYVTQHNKADRDMGELQDVSKEEIERLGKEYKNKK